MFIIDTVITPLEEFTVGDLGPDPYFSPPIAMLDSDHITTFDPTRNTAPNLLLHVARSARGMRLSLDDAGGALIVRWLNDIEHDTIRINRHKVFNRCVRDTVVNRVDYYAVVDTGLVPLKTKEKRSLGPKPKCSKRPEHISVTINGASVDVPISLERSRLGGVVTTYHGYKPRDCNSNARIPNGKCIYFHGREDRIVWYYSGELLLK